MKNYAHLFKSYPNGTDEHAKYRKVDREFKNGQYSAESCLLIQERTQYKVLARQLRPDLFKLSIAEKELAEVVDTDNWAAIVNAAIYYVSIHRPELSEDDADVQ